MKFIKDLVSFHPPAEAVVGALWFKMLILRSIPQASKPLVAQRSERSSCLLSGDTG